MINPVDYLLTARDPETYVALAVEDLISTAGSSSSKRWRNYTGLSYLTKSIPPACVQYLKACRRYYYVQILARGAFPAGFAKECFRIPDGDVIHVSGLPETGWNRCKVPRNVLQCIRSSYSVMERECPDESGRA